ncbi:DUF3667 domain-containing protein (plasmid) [Pseudoalteromonas sp. T1lg65]|uniref:DUF3667 domain-containing protein n=1 Tax=Pseudoalteromonas sp. T1lg65 TaxID=2077101 RepID=UPI003F7961D0
MKNNNKNSMNFQYQPDCLNCQAPLHSEFCTQCGQQKARRIEFAELLRIFQEGLLELKSPFLRLMWDMTVRPTETVKAYIGGQRTKYYNPFKYCLYVTLSFIIAYNLLGVDYLLQDMTVSSDESAIASQIREKLGNISIMYGNFIFALIFAIPIKWAFRKNTYNLAELYIAQLLIYSHFSFLFSPLVLLGNPVDIILITGGIILIINVVICLQLRKSKQHTVRDILHLILATLGFFVCFAIATTIITVIAVITYLSLTET